MDDEPTITAAAEAALLRAFTAEEIADQLQQPVEVVETAALQQAAEEGRPVDDVLRDWFHILIT